MSTGNPSRLLKLADREFRQLTAGSRRSAGQEVQTAQAQNAARFDQSWDRKRGAAVRLTSVLLREDDAALEARVLCRRAIGQDV